MGDGKGKRILCSVLIVLHLSSSAIFQNKQSSAYLVAVFYDIACTDSPTWAKCFRENHGAGLQTNLRSHITDLICKFISHQYVLVHFNFYICSVDIAVPNDLFALSFVSISLEIELFVRHMLATLLLLMYEYIFITIGETRTKLTVVVSNY